MSGKPTYEALKKQVARLEQQVDQYKYEAIKYQTLFNSFPHGISVSDAHGNIIETNSVAELLLGVRKEEHEKRKIDEQEWRIIRSDGSDMPPEEWASVIALKERRLVSNCEMGIIKSDTETIWLNVTAAPIPIEGNGVVIAYNNITDQKRMEEELFNRKAELQRTLDATTDGIWTWHLKTGKLTFSPKYYNMLGYEANEFPAGYDNWVNLIHPDDREKAIAVVKEFFESNSDNYQNVFRLKTKDGNYRWIHARARVVEKDVKGNALYLIGNHEDITDRHQFEKELRLHEIIVSSVSEPMAVIDSQYTYLLINKSYEDFWGVRRDAIVGKKVYEILGRDVFEATIKKRVDICLSDETIKYSAWFQSPKKGMRFMELNYYPYKSDNGEVLGLINIAYDITEQKRNEDSLRQSEEKFRALIESGPMSILLLREGKYIYGNPASIRLLGYENPEDIIGMSALETIAPEFRDHLRERIQKIDQGEDNSPVEMQLIRPDGKSIWSLSTSVSVLMDGKPTAIIMGQDITALKLAESALRESESIQLAMAENLPAGIMLIDSSTRRIESVNKQTTSLFGASDDQILGKICHNFICPASEGECPICDQGKAIDNSEREIIRKDGTRLPVLKSVIPITIKGKEKLLEYFVDISDRKKAENKLRESEEKYRKLVTTAPYGIQFTDIEGKIIFSNPAHHKIQGYADGELIGKYIWDLMADDAHRAQAKLYYQKLVKEQPLPKVYFNRDRTKDGREIDVQINWDYIYNSKGDFEGIISIISNITNQKSLEIRLQEAQKMESIGNLAGGIAHDFNNILFPIIGLTEMLLEDLPPGSHERENAEEIYKAGIRGSDLVKQILAFSRQSEHKLIPTRIQNVLKEVLKLSRASIPSYIEIDQNIQKDCGMVMADPSQIHQIGMNIITNAFHAVEDKGGKISVQLREAILDDSDIAISNMESGKYAVLSISDTGHGMSEELIGKIFDPYFTTKEQGKGTGLGLAIVYGIIKEHGGHINVHSEVGKGTTFDVYLPIMDVSNSAENGNIDNQLQTGSERILLVDDEPSIANLEKQILERLGYKVTMCVNSLEALEAFKANPHLFDLVLSDMTMPSMTGDQLACKLIAIRPDIPIIICTGFSERLNQEKAEVLGIKGFLMKPVVKSDMAKMVRNVLDDAKGSAHA
jgi:PAS domain S-box-containing protein